MKEEETFREELLRDAREIFPVGTVAKNSICTEQFVITEEPRWYQGEKSTIVAGIKDGYLRTIWSKKNGWAVVIEKAQPISDEPDYEIC